MDIKNKNLEPTEFNDYESQALARENWIYNLKYFNFTHPEGKLANSGRVLMKFINCKERRTCNNGSSKRKERRFRESEGFVFYTMEPSSGVCLEAWNVDLDLIKMSLRSLACKI